MRQTQTLHAGDADLFHRSGSVGPRRSSTIVRRLRTPCRACPRQASAPFLDRLAWAPGLRYRAAMIRIATSSFWYFSFDSSLAVGGSRSI